MHLKPVATEDTVIGQVLTKFAAGDPSLFELIAEDIDFRIDHFRDEADTSWQQADSRNSLAQVIGRLGQEVFPKLFRAWGRLDSDVFQPTVLLRPTPEGCHKSHLHRLTRGRRSDGLLSRERDRYR